MRVFFTLNGEIVSEVKKAKFNEDLFPTVCLFFPGDKIELNFGKKEFAFDYFSYYEKIKGDLIRDVSSVEVNSMEIYNVIIKFLCYQGFDKTYNALEKKNEYFIKEEVHEDVVKKVSFSDTTLSSRKTTSKESELEKAIKSQEDKPAVEQTVDKVKDQDMTYKLKDRTVIREAILQGDIHKVIQVINNEFKESKKCKYLILC